MATFRSRWLLSILLVNVPNYLAQGPPATPSLPECYILCVGNNNCADIHCSWDPDLEPQIPVNYSLHWKPANSVDSHVITGTSSRGIIRREYYNQGKLHVWVHAENQNGSARSQEAVFQTTDIMKMPPPKVTSFRHQDSIEISWNSSCKEQELSLAHCDVRYRTEWDQVWLQVAFIIHGSYEVDSPQPSTVYEFQVRCLCDVSLKSDWSPIHRIRSTETAPVGKLDVWRDCGIHRTSSDCVLTWKKLPISQARGLILGYEIRLSYNNRTVVSVNVSTVEPKGLLVCEELRCHFTSPLKDVSSVGLSAFNSRGATSPTYLLMPVSEKNSQAIHLQMDQENLTVSWGRPSQLSVNPKEYVVQYKQAGCRPGQGFDWVKVTNLSQNQLYWPGHYKNHTAYQVSLFSVSHSSKVHHLSSVVGYSLQGTSPRVPSFKVFSIATTGVTLFWEAIPLSRQKGVILYYQILVNGGADSQKVYNVSASPWPENMTFQLQHLRPGQDYEVQIRAVTVAGPGEKETAKFETNDQKDFVKLISYMLGVCLIVVICIPIGLYSACRGENKGCPLAPPCFYYKVPDARNSLIFRHKHKIGEPLAWICIPVYEPNPKISLLEIVEIQPCAIKSSLEKTSDPDGLARAVVGEENDDQRKGAEECHRMDRRYGREEYSKMIDSDDDRDRDEEEEEEDCLSSSEEEPTLGYEKHFMPTAFEVQGI